MAGVNGQGGGFDDTVLMAHADGELDAATSAAVEAAAASDPAVAARLAMFRATRAALLAAFPPEPVPDALAARIRALAAAQAPAAVAEPAGATVVPFRSRPARPRPVWRPAAVAAALALAVGLGAGWFAGQRGDAPAALAALDAPLVDALDTLPSGAEAARGADGTIRMIASFEAGDGAFCREVEDDRPDGARVVVACRGAAGWDVQLAVAVPRAGDGYAPAGALETVDAWMTAAGASAPLDPGAEAAALRGR